MTKRVYLVDTENVSSTWKELLPLLTGNDRLILFYTTNSPYFSYPDLRFILNYHESFEMVECYTGNNGLDFQLVSYLGYLLKTAAKTEYVIVSNDTGYDAVIRFWNDRERVVSRMTSRQLVKLKYQHPAHAAEAAAVLPDGEPVEAAPAEAAEEAARPEKKPAAKRPSRRRSKAKAEPATEAAAPAEEPAAEAETPAEEPAPVETTPAAEEPAPAEPQPEAPAVPAEEAAPEEETPAQPAAEPEKPAPKPRKRQRKPRQPKPAPAEEAAPPEEPAAEEEAPEVVEDLPPEEDAPVRPGIPAEQIIREAVGSECEDATLSWILEMLVKYDPRHFSQIHSDLQKHFGQEQGVVYYKQLRPVLRKYYTAVKAEN